MAVVIVAGGVAIIPADDYFTIAGRLLLARVFVSAVVPVLATAIGRCGAPVVISSFDHPMGAIFGLLR